MNKFSGVLAALAVCGALFQPPNGYANEMSFEADIDARAQYDDNIFLTAGPHDSVSGIIVTPSLAGIIKEEHWQAQLRARVRIQKYSDNTLDGNDQLFDLTGSYNAERNIFSLNVKHDLDSNLSSTSTDFGIIGRRVDRKQQSVTPGYTYLLSERSILQFSYSYLDVDFLGAENTGFTPYVSETGTGSYLYDLTEKDKLTISLVTVDYTSKNELVTYQLFMSRVGIDHKFSETFSADFQFGVSRRNSTNLQTLSFDNNGQPISITQKVDANDRGLVYDAGINQLLASGKLSARVSRNNTTNSFGGLDEIDQLIIRYSGKLSERWRYNISGRYEDITSIGSDSRRTDRELFFFESIAYYSFSENWDVNASYRYVTRKFASDNSDDRAPHSNRIYAGITYNFPSLSTF